MVLTCLDESGTVLWSKVYDQTGGPTLSAGAFCLLSDGNLAFCATTTADFGPEDGLADNFLLVNVSTNGLVVKVDADTGEPIWSTMVAHNKSTNYRAIAESPSGEITIGGSQLRGFTSNEPSMLLVQLSADGDIEDSILNGHAGSPLSGSYPAVEPLFTPLPHGGETSYDEIRDMVWTNNGLWICGQMGIFNTGSILSTGSSAITMCLTPELHPGRYAVHGGLSRDQFDRLLITPQGPLCVGYSKSFHPWPGGAEDEEDDTSFSFWIHKLPWEGRMDFHDLSSAAQPSRNESALAGSFFIYPRVVAGSQTGGFDINQPTFDLYGRGAERILGAGQVVSTTDLATTAGAPEANYIPAQVLEVKAVEKIPRSLIVDQESYLAWHQMEPDEDLDGDGRNAFTEFLFGTNPARPDDLPTYLISRDPLIIGTQRNKLAPDIIPPLLESSGLSDWFPVVPLQVEVEDLTPRLDLLKYEVEHDPGSGKRFFSFGAPE